MPKKLTTRDWIVRATQVHNDAYDYSEVAYVNSHTPVTIRCKVHGSFIMRPNDHTNGQGCRQCGIIRRNASHRYDTGEFIQRAKLKHGEHSYNYDLVNYVGSDKPVTIVCNDHGIFDQRPARHLFGDGCPVCARERAIFDGYSYEYFNRYPDECDIPAQLYVVLFSNKDHDESFYKIGITRSTTHDRFHYGYSDYHMVTQILVNLPLKRAYIAEQQLLTLSRQHKHTPIIKFGGHTECVSIDALPLIVEFTNSLRQ